MKNENDVKFSVECTKLTEILSLSHIISNTKPPLLKDKDRILTLFTKFRIGLFEFLDILLCFQIQNVNQGENKNEKNKIKMHA